MNIDEISYMDAGLALLFVLLLIMFLGWLLHRLSDGKTGTSKLSRKKRRLAIMETINVGPKSRIIILRRDNKEYLVLIGENKSLLLDGNIDINQPYTNQQFSQKIDPFISSENAYETVKTDNIDQKKKHLKTTKKKSPGVFSSFFNKSKPIIEKKEPGFTPNYKDNIHDNDHDLVDYENEEQNIAHSSGHQIPSHSVPKLDHSNMFSRIDKHNITSDHVDDDQPNIDNKDNNSRLDHPHDGKDEFERKA